jgi:hypothetical protein
MAKMKVSMGPKTTAKRAVAPPVTLTSLGAGIALTVVDASGNPVPGINSTAVTSTLTSDNPAFAITKTDELTYTASIPAGTTGLANVAATLTFNSGTPSTTFTASIAITLDVPGPAPADLTLTITPS